MDIYTNNIAKYETMLLGLCKLRAMGVQNYIMKIDSKVIAGQIEKECMSRDATLERHLTLFWRMENYFRGFSVEHIERAKNTEADELVKAAAREITLLPPDVFFQTLEDSSVKIVEPEPRIVNVIQGEDW
jgi:ribonuclease HI